MKGLVFTNIFGDISGGFRAEFVRHPMIIDGDDNPHVIKAINIIPEEGNDGGQSFIHAIKEYERSGWADECDKSVVE